MKFTRKPDKLGNLAKPQNIRSINKCPLYLNASSKKIEDKITKQCYQYIKTQ